MGDMAKKAKKDPEFVIRCTHCMTDDYRLSDVDPTSPVKIYTDTPKKFSTPAEKPSVNKTVKTDFVTPDARELFPIGLPSLQTETMRNSLGSPVMKKNKVMPYISHEDSLRKRFADKVNQSECLPEISQSSLRQSAYEDVTLQNVRNENCVIFEDFS